MKESDIRHYLSQQQRPVVVLFHDLAEAPSTRRLQQDNLNGTTPLTEYEISSYQVCGLLHACLFCIQYHLIGVSQIFYWVEFAVILLLLSGVFAIVGMDIVPDSLLFAKFQSSRTNKVD